MHLNPRIYKLVCAICLLLSTSALVMMASTPASSYEVSIYTTNLSPLVWVLLITSMGGSIFLLVCQALDKESQENNWWLVPLFTLMFSSLIVLLLPVLKGYYSSSRGDALTHIGYIKDILLMGHFSQHNIYPAQHMLPAMLAQVIGLSARSAASYVSPLFSVGYVLFVYLLARTIFHKKGEIILACIAGSILLIPHSGHLEASRPAALMFPLVLALFFRSWGKKSFNYKLLFILVLIVLPFLHPLATLTMMVALVLVSLLQAGYNAIHTEEPRKEIPLNFLLILAVVSFLWYADLFIFRVGVDYIVKLIHLEATASPAINYGSLLEKGGVHGFDTIILLFKLYGGEIIYGTLASIAVVTVAWKLISHRRQEKEVVMLSILFAALCLAYLVYWAGLAFGVGETYSRIIFYIPIVSIMLASLTLYQIILRSRHRKLVIVLVACLILISATFSVFNKYSSTHIHQPNAQATYMEIEGTKWIVNYRDLSTKITHIGGASLYRFGVAEHGVYWFHTSKVPLDPSFPIPPVRIPDHFGYQYYENIGQSVAENTYLALTKLDWILYEEIWKPPVPTRWGKEDFDELEHDPTADKLYSNGEFDVWYIQHSSLTASGINWRGDS